MSAETQDASSVRPKVKKNEFEDGRKRAPYTWGESLKDWFKQSFQGRYTDSQVEERLLSSLPFFPESDGKRRASIINTEIGNGQYIHELFIENIEEPLPSSRTSGEPEPTRDVVLIHGYAASLGLFIDNFDSLSRIPGIKIHAIDLLGFGFSSRPKFPTFPADTKQEIYKVEDWFIDAIEEWRKKRNINRFMLLGHSFGGYLSCAYALKYNKSITNPDTKISSNLIEKLVLISPVGVERHKNSLLKNNLETYISNEQQKLENSQAPSISIQQEVLADQEAIVHKSGDRAQEVEEEKQEERTRRRKIIDFMWEKNFSPFSIVRNAGPAKSKMISLWTTHRFAHTYYQDVQSFQNMHDYIYRVFNAKGSGEYAITRILAVGALAKLPLLDRCPEKFVKMGLPTLWMYGDKDWMNDEAGLQMTNDINDISMKEIGKKMASFKILPNSGHHLYLDNPPAFAKEVFKFLGYKR
ncbi:Alpha/Beta hydrolase protein [Scheffersomyces xylosifermentans]|uniref:Alpha/Beta hydrolase protein n=1 Tax=Scheffersomyces xylosifermentans TaxID=1304137 RepID=UPI00315D0D51